MPTSRIRATSSLAGNLIVVAGEDKGSGMNTVEFCNPATNSWSSGNALLPYTLLYIACGPYV